MKISFQFLFFSESALMCILFCSRKCKKIIIIFLFFFTSTIIVLCHPHNDSVPPLISTWADKNEQLYQRDTLWQRRGFARRDWARAAHLAGRGSRSPPGSSWQWGPAGRPGRPWAACWGRGSVQRRRRSRPPRRRGGWGRATARSRMRTRAASTAPAESRAAGFGPSWPRWAAAEAGGRPECFLRYIQRQTAGSFAAWSREPLEECGGPTNLGALRGWKEREQQADSFNMLQ